MQLDVQFNNYNGGNKKFYPNGYKNPWGESISGNGSPIRKWSNSSWFMWRIENDSIKKGLKPANNPNDFTLIETWSMTSSTDWVIGGKKANMITTWMRKPEIYKGNPTIAGSFGTSPETSEWTYQDQPYWQKKNAGWPLEILNVGNDIGKHFMNEPTHYKSTVSSTVYKVSEGYSNKETIGGMRTGVNVAEFLANLIKANPKQDLKVKNLNKVLGNADKLSNNDSLIVMSADSVNTTKYLLRVTAEGLSSNAVLTSTKYEVAVITNPTVVTSAASVAKAGTGAIKKVEYGTPIKTVVANVVVPQGATLTVTNGKGEYVSNQIVNFDSLYVDVTANHDIFLEVVAEDGKTTIVYQIQPAVSTSTAFILSDVYSVDERNKTVTLVPRGTTVKTFMKNVIPSFGASALLVDKNGLERKDGDLYQDDKVIVTSQDKKVTVVYFLSMLRNEFITETTYLAYVTSDVYAVDQVKNTITGASGKTLISEYMGNLKVVTGATAKLIDKNGVVRTTGDLNGGDKVVVTSKDGKITVEYALILDLTNVDLSGIRNIELYPNPTNADITVSGVVEGNRIQVFNAIGAPVRDIIVKSGRELVPLQDQPAGIYMILVSENEKLIGRYKAIKH
jgi:hypothetical protein